MASVVNGIVSEGPGAESVPDTEPQPELVVGLLAAPGPASELTESLVGEIADRLVPEDLPDPGAQARGRRRAGPLRRRLPVPQHH